MADDVIEIAREQILNSTQDYISPNIEPHQSSRKMVETLEDLSFLSDLTNDLLTPVHNVMKTKYTELERKNTAIPMYLFIDTNVDRDIEEQELGKYVNTLKDFVKERINSVISNNVSPNCEVHFCPLHSTSNVNDSEWKLIERLIELLTPDSRIYLFDMKSEVSELSSIDRFKVSDSINLSELLNLLRSNDKKLPLETLGLFSNSVQDAIHDDFELFIEFKKHVMKNDIARVLLLPASRTPMKQNFSFERAGIIESLVASSSIEGGHNEWIESSQQKLSERIPVSPIDLDYLKRDVAISATTFFSIPLILQSQTPRYSIQEDTQRNFPPLGIKSIDSLTDDCSLKFDHSLCGRLETEWTNILYHSLDYVNSYFNRSENEVHKAVLFASVLSQISGIDILLENEKDIRGKWDRLKQSKHIVGKQTMLDERDGRERQGLIGSRFLEMNEAWHTKRKSDKRKKKILKILDIILPENAEINAETALSLWKEEIRSLRDPEQRTSVGPTANTMFAMFLLDKEVCTHFVRLWRESKKVTHGNPFRTLSDKIINHEWTKLYLESQDKRQIPFATANEVFRELKTGLDTCGWVEPIETPAMGNERKKLDWWDD